MDRWPNNTYEQRVGRYVVRTDGTDARPRVWRVFAGSVAIFHSEHLIEAFGFAMRKHDEHIVATTACPACNARHGQRCVTLKSGETLDAPHTRRQDIYNAETETL